MVHIAVQAKAYGPHLPTTQAKVYGLHRPTTQVKVYGLHRPTTQAKVYGLHRPTTQAKVYGLHRPTTQAKVYGLHHPKTQAKVYGLHLPTTQAKVYGLHRPKTQAKVYEPYRPTTQAKVYGQHLPTIQSMHWKEAEEISKHWAPRAGSLCNWCMCRPTASPPTSAQEAAQFSCNEEPGLDPTSNQPRKGQANTSRIWFNIRTRDQVPILEDIVGYRPTINAPTTELNTVVSGKNYCMVVAD